MWCGVVWCGVVWCGVVWCGVVWCGVVWCGVVAPFVNQLDEWAYSHAADMSTFCHASFATWWHCFCFSCCHRIVATPRDLR